MGSRKEAGYHRLYTGKWHVPGTPPARLGFADSAAIPAVLNGRDRGRYIEAYRANAEARGYELVPGHIENLTERDVAQLKRPGKAPCGTAEIALEHFLETWQRTQLLEREGSANGSVQTEGRRYVFRWKDEDELFDLAEDPHEIRDVAGETARQGELEALREMLVGEIERTDGLFAALIRERMAAKAA